MTWQKVLFFGGAILLLSACSSATAPSEPAQRQVTKGPARFSASYSGVLDSASAQSGYYVRAGAVTFPGPIEALP